MRDNNWRLLNEMIERGDTLKMRVHPLELAVALRLMPGTILIDNDEENGLDEEDCE